MPPALPSHGASEEPDGVRAPDSIDRPARPVVPVASDEDGETDSDRDLLLLRALLDGPLFS